MSILHPASTAKISGHPIHTMLVPFPVVCYILALLTDIVFAVRSDALWSTFSIWLLGVGIVMSIAAAIFGAVDFFSNGRIRAERAAWPHALGNSLALVLAIINFFVHRADAVLPWGLVLSAVTAAIVIVTSWLGGDMVYRHGVGVAD